jgi:hypothetical protein
MVPPTPDPSRGSAETEAAAVEVAVVEGEVERLLAEARRVLESLRAGRATVEAKLEEQGRSDAIRQVTGSSALDAAIVRAERMIETLEGLPGSRGRSSPAG